MTVGSQVKQCLANINSLEAGLSLLALNTINEEAQRSLHEEMITMVNIRKDLQQRIEVIEREEEQYKGF